MTLKDPRRRAVSERLRDFFAEIHQRASEGVHDLWNKVKDKIERPPTEPHQDKQERS